MNLLAKLFGRPTADAETWLDPTQLAALLATPAPPLVIDVRNPDEFTGPLGHIEAARNIPLNDIPAQSAALQAENRPLVLVCHTDRRSAAASRLLRDAGAQHVHVLRGGMVAWRAGQTP
jgi:rhodanese-related sulfurtransferase